MKNADRFSSLAWLLVGILIALWSLKYGFGSFAEPGIGFITFFGGTILGLLSVILFLTSFQKGEVPSAVRNLWAGKDVKKVGHALLLLIVWVLMLRPAGFLISTFLLLFLLFRVKGTYGLFTNLIVSFLVTMGSYLVFEAWLHVQFPQGILG
jgi:putative tricarboxylic transport membrane protein